MVSKQPSYREKGGANEKKRTKIIILLIFIAAVALTPVILQNSIKPSIKRTVNSHTDTLAALADDIAENGSVGDCSFKGAEQISYWPETGMVEFVYYSFGLGSSMSYYGFYYSPQDMPLGFQGTWAEFTTDGEGWRWEEENGDNWEYTERISDGWFFFEIHF